MIIRWNMTATAAMVAEISSYSVDDETKFTKAVFARLSAVAKVLLDQDDPGLGTVLYDHAHVLLIVHLYETGVLGKGTYTSEKIGDYSYSKAAGESSYILEYRAVIASGSGRSNLEGQERADADMEEMHLDQGEVPKYPEDVE